MAPHSKKNSDNIFGGENLFAGFDMGDVAGMISKVGSRLSPAMNDALKMLEQYEPVQSKKIKMQGDDITVSINKHGHIILQLLTKEKGESVYSKIEEYEKAFVKSKQSWFNRLMFWRK